MRDSPANPAILRFAKIVLKLLFSLNIFLI